MEEVEYARMPQNQVDTACMGSIPPHYQYTSRVHIIY